MTKRVNAANELQAVESNNAVANAVESAATQAAQTDVIELTASPAHYEPCTLYSANGVQVEILNRYNEMRDGKKRNYLFDILIDNKERKEGVTSTWISYTLLKLPRVARVLGAGIRSAKAVTFDKIPAMHADLDKKLKEYADKANAAIEGAKALCCKYKADAAACLGVDAVTFAAPSLDDFTEIWEKEIAAQAEARAAAEKEKAEQKAVEKAANVLAGLTDAQKAALLAMLQA